MLQPCFPHSPPRSPTIRRKQNQQLAQKALNEINHYTMRAYGSQWLGIYFTSHSTSTPLPWNSKKAEIIFGEMGHWWPPECSSLIQMGWGELLQKASVAHSDWNSGRSRSGRCVSRLWFAQTLISTTGTIQSKNQCDKLNLPWSWFQPQ